MYDYKQQVADYFNRRTAYDAEGDSHPQEAKRLLDYVPLKSGQTILDLATGTGLVAMQCVVGVPPIVATQRLLHQSCYATLAHPRRSRSDRSCEKGCSYRFGNWCRYFTRNAKAG